VWEGREGAHAGSEACALWKYQKDCCLDGLCHCPAIISPKHTAHANVISAGPLVIPAQIDPELLSEALTAARRALRRMNDKDIPARLRDIASRSGRLPTPFTKRLLAELDSSEWLRAEARAEIPEPEDPVQESASFLFLARPDGWAERIEALVSGHQEAVERSEIKRLETELRRAVARVGRLQQNLDQAERREQEAVGGIEQRLAAAAAAQRRSRARSKSIREALTAQVAAADGEVTRLTAENADRRKKLEPVRSGREKAAPAPKPPKIEPAWSLEKPKALARHLDDINRALAVSPAKPLKPTPAAKPTRLSGLPAGVSPDRAEAIVWLLTLPGTVQIAIDGWNAAHLIKSPPVPATRNRIIEAARRLILASAGKRRVTAVFDSSQLGESFSADDVVVTFVASADEELIKMAKRDPTGLVVITSDRRVREAVEKSGAIGLWSEALIEWLKTGGRRTFRS